MKKVKLNDLIVKGDFDLGLKIGVDKSEIEKALGRSLRNADIQTPDVDFYYVELETGIVLSILFDKLGVCYEINLDLEENRMVDLVVQLDQQQKKIDEETSFDELVEIISKLDVDWEFDRRKIFLQTACIRLKNGLRLFYAFGNKKERDYGMYSIKSVLETHKFEI